MAVASSAPAPFVIHVADTELAGLAARLRQARLSPSVATQPWAAASPAGESTRAAASVSGLVRCSSLSPRSSAHSASSRGALGG